MNVKLLIQKAKNVALNSYSPYSHFRVGAALLTKDNKIFTGTNVENRSYGGTICAERVAISKAISCGHKEFKAICVIGLDYDKFLPPCGICRQFISEFGANIKIILTNNKEEYKITSIKDLLPMDSLFELK